MSLSIYYTKDGSTTLINNKLDETYHSQLGAIQESDHVFLKKGLDVIKEKNFSKISVFEMGFGTGLNAWRTSIWARTHRISVNYLTVEKYPLDLKLINQLNFKEFSSSPHEHLLFDNIHQCIWNKWCELNPYFKINKWKADICTINFSHLSNYFDLCFFDGFAPNKQPEIWSIEILKSLHHILKKGGLVTTYCSQGKFRRNLEDLGFEVYRVDGPPGKREMIQAFK